MIFVRVIGFSVIVLLCYTLFANILPQVQSNPPEDDEPIVAGEMDMAGMLAWGEKLFSGKGTCTLCHNNLGRAPDLLEMDLATAFDERLKDASYAGEAKGQDGAEAIETYLRESMVDPSAYVVAGFGKKGSDDKVSPMPDVSGAPISLSEPQINALIAFLQSRAGVEATVSLPEAGDAEADADEEDDEGPAETAEAAIEKFTCGACHDLAGSGADTGPKLNGTGKRLGLEGLRKAILEPNADIAKGFEADTMPPDYAEQMRISELNLIVDYLMNLPEGGGQ
ncbi:MAG: c-type cytochrome [Rhodospirillaceae bacterium]|jgi:mono/diheme cytochrome c family protein|nr:c-type cytochrome [Rhodospirillaceae bacterium]